MPPKVNKEKSLEAATRLLEDHTSFIEALQNMFEEHEENIKKIVNVLIRERLAEDEEFIALLEKDE